MAFLAFFRVCCDSDDCGLWLMAGERQPTDRRVMATEFTSFEAGRSEARRLGWIVRYRTTCPVCVKKEK